MVFAPRNIEYFSQNTLSKLSSTLTMNRSTYVTFCVYSFARRNLECLSKYRILFQHRLRQCSTMFSKLPLTKQIDAQTARHYNTLQHTATHYNTLQHTATHCNPLQHTALHRSTLQHVFRIAIAKTNRCTFCACWSYG